MGFGIRIPRYVPRYSPLYVAINNLHLRALRCLGFREFRVGGSLGFEECDWRDFAGIDCLKHPEPAATSTQCPCRCCCCCCCWHGKNLMQGAKPLNPKLPHLGVLIIRILLYRVLYWGPPILNCPI